MKTIIIAEAGVNHNGKISTALKMITVAKKAGADFIKFQSFKTENLVTKKASLAKYQKSNTLGKNISQFKMLKKLEIDFKFHKKLISKCKKQKIKFLSTPFDLESIDILKNFNLNYYKIPSGEINNLIYLQKIGKLKKTIFLSTGMSTLKEITKAVSILTKSGTSKNKIFVLHCNTSYPTPYNDVNLKAILTIRNKVKIKTGLSDHSLGVEVPIAAVALGASVIEKHFTLNKKLVGPDHKASLEPIELKDMISKIRNIEKSLGDGLKRITKSEKVNLQITRKSIVAKTNIKKGEIFSNKNITLKRPGNGISPMRWFDIIGKKANKNFKEDDLIKI